MLAEVRRYVLPTMQKHGEVVAWIVDDTGFPKQGKHSVGVARQYCGQVGKQDNCQVAVSLSVSTWNASLPIAWRLYLPEVWCQDTQRCQQGGVPEGVEFQTQPEIALQQIRQALQQKVPKGVVQSAPARSTRLRSMPNELLSEAAMNADDPSYGNAICHGNMALGRVALRQGDVTKAGKLLLEAGRTPGSTQLNSFGPDMTLAQELLEKGEREVVLQYFALCHRFWGTGAQQLEAWSTTVREGGIPKFGANLR